MSSDEFSHHEPCPDCGSKDNLGVWKDGHKYCFGCGARMNPLNSLTSIKNKYKAMTSPEEVTANANGIDISNFTFNIPAKAMTWLRKYGIKDEEIKGCKIQYDVKDDSLVFPIYFEKDLKVVNKRYFGNDVKHPKYITEGNKVRNMTVIVPVDSPRQDTVVLVEDFTSAIKVGRQFPCIPLLGAAINVKALASLSGRFKHIRVWLDSNKAFQSVIEASRGSQFVTSSRSVITELDPKEYSDMQIYKFVESTFGKEVA